MWVFLSAWPSVSSHVCLVAEALCFGLHGGGDDIRLRRASLRGHHFPILAQALGQSPSYSHPTPPTFPSLSTPRSFSHDLFLHLLPRDTLIVPMAINTSLSMWQPRIQQSPSQPSHWLQDCEKLQQSADSHIHMEICEYKYRAEAGTQLRFN